MVLRKDLLVLGALLSVAALLALGLRQIEWVEKSVDTGFSEAARTEPFLAANRFLERFGVATEHSRSVAMLDDLPPTDHVIVMTNTRRTLSAARLEALMGWVSEGGRLILVAIEPDAEEDPGAAPLLEQAGIYMRFLDDDDESAVTESAPANLEDREEDPAITVEEVLNSVLFDSADICLSPAETAVLEGVSGPPQRTEFWHGKALYTNAKPTLAAVNQGGDQLLMLPWDAGSLVALTAAELWENPHIHCHHNAHLLRLLSADRRKLWWLTGTEMKPLHTLIAARWPWVLGILGLWLLLWCWRAAVRERAPQRTVDTERRNVMEHIDGMARFLYQQGRQTALLEHLREQLRIDASDRDAIVAVARTLGETPERIVWALTGELGNNPRDFITAVDILQRLTQSQRTSTNGSRNSP